MSKIWTTSKLHNLSLQKQRDFMKISRRAQHQDWESYLLALLPKMELFSKATQKVPDEWISIFRGSIRKNFKSLRAIARCVSPISRFQFPKILKIRENFDVRFDSRFSKECNENWRTKMPLRTCVGNRGDMRNCGATFRKKICAIFDHMLNSSLVSWLIQNIVHKYEKFNMSKLLGFFEIL